MLLKPATSHQQSHVLPQKHALNAPDFKRVILGIIFPQNTFQQHELHFNMPPLHIGPTCTEAILIRNFYEAVSKTRRLEFCLKKTFAVSRIDYIINI